MNRQSEWSTSSIADVIADKCEKLGWSYKIRGKIFSIEKSFKKDNDVAFNTAQAEGFGIIKLMPTTAPSVTYGLENPRYAEYAKRSGFIKLSKSSCNGQVLRKLKDLVLG